MLRLVFDCMARNLAELLLWTGLGTCLGVILGIALTILCWRRRAWLNMGFAAFDPFYRWSVVAVWVVGIPCCMALAGLSFGLGMEARSFVHKEELVEQSGKAAFQTVVSLAISTCKNPQLEKQAQVAQARAYLESARPVPIEQVEQLAMGLPEWVESEACHQVNLRIQAEGQGTAQGVARFVIRWTLGWWTKSSVDKRMKVIRPVVADLKRTDQDGLVTSEEIAISICRVHLKPHVEHFVFDFFFMWALHFALYVPLLVLPPVLLAQAVAFARRWWVRTHPPELPPLVPDPHQEGSAEAPVEDPNLKNAL